MIVPLFYEIAGYPRYGLWLGESMLAKTLSDWLIISKINSSNI